MLENALNGDSVAVGLRAENWRQAIELSGKLLVASGAVKEEYVPAMVRTVEELGPYAVIAPGVAIPHARPEDGARRVGLSLAVLAEPVEFGSKENDPVDLLFGFSTTDSDAHVEMLGALADFIEQRENCEALRNAATVEDVLEIVKGSGADA